MLEKRRYPHIEESYEAGHWHTNRKEDAESKYGNRRTSASMGVEILAKKCCLEKGVFDKKCFFLEKDLSDPSDNWHAGPQDSLGKRNLNKLGPFKNGLLQAMHKKKQNPLFLPV